MKRLIAILMICAVAVTAASAQDWQYDAESDFNINCTLVNTLHDEFGEENIMMRNDDFFLTFSEMLLMLYSQCLPEEDRVITLGDGPDSDDEGESSVVTDALADTATLSGGDDIDEIDVTTELQDGQMFSLPDVDCSITVADRFEEDFNVIITGEPQTSASVDVFLPGETQALELEYAHRRSVNVMGLDVPTRTEWAERESFPMGLYSFDVHVDDETFRFQWERKDEAFNTVVLICLGSEAEVETANLEPAAADDNEAEATMTDSDDTTENIVVLENDKIHTIQPEGCVVAVDTRYEKDFNLFIVGNGQDGLSVDVYLPGESEPLVMDETYEYTADIGVPLPVRNEWAIGDEFPLGTYTFDVHIDGNTHRFQWNREDEDYRNFALTCNREGVDDESLGVLADNERAPIPETDCLVWTEAWDEDFNLIVIGENQDGMAVEVYFPGEIQPEAMDGVSANEFDDGMPYRIEWIDGRHFPLGLYNIELTIDEQSHHLKWQREEDDINTFVVECAAVEEE